MVDAPIIIADDVTKSFNGDAGVFDVDLDVEAGSIVGLIGPSGSGKTTTVRLVAGLISPDSGAIRVFGTRPTDFDREMQGRIGYMPQDSVLYPEMTLRQNLDFAGSLFGLRNGRKERVAELIEFFEIDGAADRLPREASGGEKRRISLASTLIHSPDLVFLDEPTAGLDPVLRRKLWDSFRDLAREDQRTLLVTTQYVGEAAYCDRVAVLAGGRVLTLDTPEGLRRQAFGGDLLDVEFAVRPGEDALGYLSGISQSGLDWLSERSVRLVVDDAQEATPRIHGWASDHGVELARAEPHSPPYDDVFVELVEKYEHARDREASAKHVEPV